MNSNWSYSPETLNSGQNWRFLSRVTLKFDVWHWKTIGHFFYAAPSFVHHFIAVIELKLELRSGNSLLGSKSTIFYGVILKFDGWQCKTIRHLSNIKLCAWFHYHMWIQNGVTVWKRLSWVLTSVTSTFDLWPWLFAWTSRPWMVITPEKFRMIRWQEHCQKGVRDGRTDRQTERSVLRTVWSQLKMTLKFQGDLHGCDKKTLICHWCKLNYAVNWTSPEKFLPYYRIS